MSRFLRVSVLIVFASVAPFLCSCQSKSAPASPTPSFKETVVAGTAEDFMLVRHLVIRGSDYEIGKKIGEVAREIGVRLAPTADSLRNKVQREYVKKNYPILYERMRGVADAFGLDEIKTINSNVAATGTAFESPDYAPGRTLWHAIYDLGERSINVRFYMRDRVDPSDKTKETAEYTEYLTFKLKTGK